MTLTTNSPHSCPSGALVVRVGADRGAWFEAKWRRAGRQFKRRVGPAWLEQSADGRWRPRRGRLPDGYFDEKRATVAMAALIAEHEEHEAAIERGERRRREHGVTVRELAAEWLDYLKHEKGARPSTLLDYRYMLAEPGTPHRRGNGVNAGRILRAFGDTNIRDVTVGQVSAFLRELDKAGIGPRTVNKHRQVLAAMFNYALREDTHGLSANPVAATTKRRELPPAVLDFYEPHEIEALANAAGAGIHRVARNAQIGDDELTWQAWEDAQDGELFRLAGYTGLRLGELLALRWEDVDFDTRRLIVHRAVSAGVEGPTKSWQARIVPLADPAAEALDRLRAREHYTERDDYVFCSRLGRRLDASAVRRRYDRARDAAGLRKLRFHSLRHAAGSLVAREADARFVQAFLGHSRLSTTERYLHAKSRPQDVETLNRAFASRVAG